MVITTRTGDSGYSCLLTGEKVSKGDLRLEAYGTVDELNAVLGIVISEMNDAAGIRLSRLRQVQKLLFLVGSDLATPLDSKADIKRISSEEVKLIEGWINELEEFLPELKRFILPGGSKLSSYLHLARTVCRRAERCSVRLSEEEKINPQVIVFLNRLSDYLFLLAREGGHGLH